METHIFSPEDKIALDKEITATEAQMHYIKSGSLAAQGALDSLNQTHKQLSALLAERIEFLYTGKRRDNVIAA